LALAAFALLLLAPAVSVAQDSPLIQGTTADMWLVDPETGQITGYDVGKWLDGVDPGDYPLIDLGPLDALLVNRLPNSSVRMTPGQPAISLIGIGDAALMAGAGGLGGHRNLTVTPASGAYTNTIAVVMGVSSSLLVDGDHRLTWTAIDTGTGTTVIDDSYVIPKGSGATGENGYHIETFYLVYDGDYNVSVNLRGATIDTTVVATYDLTIDPSDQRRDTDGDGIPDAVEVDMGLNPFEDDWMADKDGNGWSEFDEWLRRYCLDPNTLQPLDAGPNCLDANGDPLDSDRDDWTDFDEILRGTNHLDPEPVLVEQSAAPPANEKVGLPGLSQQAPSAVIDGQFCTDGTTFYFDTRIHADSDDDINYVIYRIGADNESFTTPIERIEVNFYNTGAIARGAIPAVSSFPNGSDVPPDRWLDGPIADFTMEQTDVDDWHIFGSVPVGTEPFAAGDSVNSIDIRDALSGSTSAGPFVISGDPADCGGPPAPAPTVEYTEYEAKQRLRFKDFPAANRLYEVEHLVAAGTGILSVPPTANILLDQQSAGADQNGYKGIVVQSITAAQDNIAGVDFRIAAGTETDGVEDIILNIWADSLRDGELLLSRKIESVFIDGDPDRPIAIRFEPVAVQPGQPIFFEFRKKNAALVRTSGDSLGGGGVVEIDGAAAAGTTDLVFDVYYDANFANGIGGTRAGFQWWTIAAAGVDGSLAYDATLLLHDDDITAAGLLPTDVSTRRRMTTLANALGGSQLPEMRLPAGDSLVVSAVHRHQVPALDGSSKAPADYSRIYKRWLPRTNDITPVTMLDEVGEGTWTTPEEWRREFIAYLVPRLVVPAPVTLDEASTLEVAIVEAALSEEARIDGSGGVQVINGIYQPGQPIYSYQPGQPIFGDLLSHQSPYVDDWEDNLERLSATDFNLDQSVVEVRAALVSGQPLEPLGQWLREKFYAGVPGTASDKYMASQVMIAFPDVCKVPTPDIAARQADVDGWNEFLDQCPAWVDDAGYSQHLEDMRDRCYLVRLNLLPGATSEIGSDATLLDRTLDSDADGATNRDEIEIPIRQVTLPWSFDSDGDGIADDLDQCPIDPYNDCSANPIFPNVTVDGDFEVFEPETGSDFALVSVQLDRIYDVPVTVCYEAIMDLGDTATADVDFQAVTGCVTIEPGQLSALIEIPINADAELDGGETFTVRITSVTNGEIGDDGLVVVTLNDSIPDGNDAPVFTSAATANAASGSTDTGYTATATDADGDTLTFSISGGVDQAEFSIDSSSGVLSFVTPSDFNAPTDADANNDYEVQLTVDDGNTGTDTLDLVVTVIEGAIYVEVTYPTPNANLGGVVTTITVTGNVVDPTGAPINPADIASLDVNGHLATLDAGDPSRWSAQVNVIPGTASYPVNFRRSDNSTQSLFPVWENTEVYTGFDDIEFDAANDRALVLDTYLDAIISVRATNGFRSVLTINFDGQGPNFGSPTGFTHDAANDRVLITDQSADALFSVDLTTGARAYVSRAGFVGAGPAMPQPWDVAIDAANNRALVVDLNLDAIIAVDLTNGDRSIFSDAVTGTGPVFSVLRDVVIDSANNRALVLDAGIRAVLAVDLTSGDRAIISNGSTGTGQTFSVPENIALHSAFNRVLVADQTRGLIAVDLATGDRTVIDQPALDYGSNGSRLQGVAMDLNRSRILYTDSTVDAIFATGPGARTILTDNATGTVDDSAVLFGIQGIGFDKIGNRVLAADSYKKVMWQIDLDTAHRSHVSSDVIGSGPSIDFPGKMDVDTDNGLAYYVEQNSSSLVVADLATGDRTVVSSFSVGAGPNFTSVMDVDLDVANNRAFVSGSSANGGALFTVNLATGDRTLVSDDVTGTGSSMTVPASVAFDSATGRALVMDWNADILFAIDLTSGDRTVVSDNVGIGVGPNFSVPFDMALDIDNNRAVVTDYGADSLFAIDLTSGDRTSLVSFDDIQQLNLLNPYYVVLDLDNDRAFVYDLSVTGMLVIELSTGERAVMAK
jgi:hypothetical protein